MTSDNSRGPRMTERLESDVKEALDVSYRAERKIDSHNDICSVRYEGIQKGMTSIIDDINTLSTRMWVASGSVIASCIAVIIVLLTKGH